MNSNSLYTLNWFSWAPFCIKLGEFRETRYVLGLVLHILLLIRWYYVCDKRKIVIDDIYVTKKTSILMETCVLRLEEGVASVYILQHNWGNELRQSVEWSKIEYDKETAIGKFFLKKWYTNLLRFAKDWIAAKWTSSSWTEWNACCLAICRLKHI